MYTQGLGVTRDYRAALKWYKLAADQGNDKAQNNFGVMYLQGLGVTQDYKAAIKWFKLAAVQGYVEAQYNQGLMYYKGEGVSQDYKAAIKWFIVSRSSFCCFSPATQVIAAFKLSQMKGVSIKV